MSVSHTVEKHRDGLREQQICQERDRDTSRRPWTKNTDGRHENAVRKIKLLFQAQTIKRLVSFLSFPFSFVERQVLNRFKSFLFIYFYSNNN